MEDDVRPRGAGLLLCRRDAVLTTAVTGGVGLMRFDASRSLAKSLCNFKDLLVFDPCHLQRFFPFNLLLRDNFLGNHCNLSLLTAKSVTIEVHGDQYAVILKM